MHKMKFVQVQMSLCTQYPNQTTLFLKININQVHLTLLDLSGEQLVHPGMDMACIPSIFIKTSQIFF